MSALMRGVSTGWGRDPNMNKFKQVSCLGHHISVLVGGPRGSLDSDDLCLEWGGGAQEVPG